MIRFLIVIIAFLLSIQVVSAEPNVGKVPGIRFVLPLNPQKEWTLMVHLPPNFIPVENFKNQNLNNKKIFFVPINNLKAEKKEMILIIPKLNSKISAFEALDKFTEQFKKTSQKMSILKEQKKEYDGFIHAARLIIYEYNNQVELLNIYAVSSPTNLVVLQYSIKIQSNSEIQPAINKMLTFFNQRVHIKKQSITQPQIKLKDSI